MTKRTDNRGRSGIDGVFTERVWERNALPDISSVYPREPVPTSLRGSEARFPPLGTEHELALGPAGARTFVTRP